MNRLKPWLPLIFCLAHFSLLLFAARQHPFGTYATETDFYHFYAPDAERLAHGQFPVNTFQGPGYPAIIALLGKLTGQSQDLFTIGKGLSVLCAVLCGWLIFKLFAQTFDDGTGKSFWIGLGAQALAIVSGEFLQFSISATTDVFFLLLSLATLVALTNAKWHPLTRVLLAGAATGAAYVTRYNGLFLLLSALAAILLLDLFGLAWRERARYAVIFFGMFFLVSLPWLIANGRHNGSPFYNTNYLNIATEFYPELVKGKINQDGTRTMEERFHSFGEVLRYDPWKLAKRYPGNLWESIRNITKEHLVTRGLAFVGLLGLVCLLWFERRNPAALMLVLAGTLYLLLMALNHWETRYYFFVMMLIAGFTAYAVVKLSALAQERGWLPDTAALAVTAGLLVVLAVSSLWQGGKQLREFLDNHPWEVIATRDYLCSIGQCNANISQNTRRIVARKPHVPYMCRNEWVFFPQADSLEDLQAWLQQNPVDYLIISQRELKERKKLRALGNPSQAPAWLKPVWSNKEPLVVLYQPMLNATPIAPPAPTPTAAPPIPNR